MNDAVDRLNSSEAVKSQKDAEEFSATQEYKGKLELEKVRADTKLSKEEKEAHAAKTKLPANTPGESWTANMPEHHLDGYAQVKSKNAK